MEREDEIENLKNNSKVAKYSELDQKMRNAQDTLDTLNEQLAGATTLLNE